MEEVDCILLYVVLPPAAWCSYWPIFSETSSYGLIIFYFVPFDGDMYLEN